MTVELWIGQEFDTSHERKALDSFVAQMNGKFGQSNNLYLILANYYIDGRQIDLTVLKEDAIILIELKECTAPFVAVENGSWQTIPDNVVIGTGRQNPFEQAKDYRFRWINLLQNNHGKFLPQGKAQSMDFYHVSAFVVISPSLPLDCQNYLPHLPWFRLVGMDELSVAIQQQTSRKLNFSEQEMRTLVKSVLRLRQDSISRSKFHALRGSVPQGGFALTPERRSQTGLERNKLDLLSISNQIGRYKILELLGRGGMGEVYRAYDPDLERKVVIKFITSSPLTIDQGRERFRREVQSASQLNHPHIITIYDVSLEHNPPYVVMELLTGGTLEERLKQNPLAWPEALILVRLLAQALAYAHQAGVIHRDIKPANVMFAGDEITTLKLVDFGLARQQGGEALTQIGEVIGTLTYMAPEQALGEMVDRRADIFALGIILFEAIAGHNPLDKGSTILTLQEVMSDAKIDTSSLTDKAPPEVIKLIEKATAKDRNQRYQTCEELLNDLEHCLNNLTGDSTVFTQSSVASRSHRISVVQKTGHNLEISEAEIESPYGTMPSNSRFYIERATDEHCWEGISKTQALTLFIQAPRQMGKSSLIRRMIDRAEKEYHKQSIFIDFQKFPKQYFADEEKFLIDLCVMMSDALGVSEAIDHYWQGRRTNIRKCSLYLAEYIIPQINAPFILAMDEVERMLDSSFQANFFGMLRTWHNDRAYSENFALMTLLLSSSTEPYLFIDNPHQSPFNVAEIILLEDFTRQEFEELNRRHHSPLNPGQIDELMTLIDGHPFLTRLALYQLVTGRVDWETLLARATEDNGPFGDHLSHYRQRILEKLELKEALTQISRHHAYEENQVFHRLKGAGLIKQVGSQVVLRNNLYTRYFEERFNG